MWKNKATNSAKYYPGYVDTPDTELNRKRTESGTTVTGVSPEKYTIVTEESGRAYDWQDYSAAAAFPNRIILYFPRSVFFFVHPVFQDIHDLLQ